MRLLHIDWNWVLRLRLIAVRQVDPAKDLLTDNRLSGLLEKYLISVLHAHGFDISLLSATSDAGSDVKRPCKVLLPGLRALCLYSRTYTTHVFESSCELHLIQL